MERLNWKPRTEIEKAGLRIVRLLNKQKYQAFFVGGFVRDLFTKKISDNLDIATDALPAEIELNLDKVKIPHKPIGKKFGTILAVPEGLRIEITTFRREGRYSDSRHPDQVEFIGEYLDDAQRRDFTVNAMYLNPATGELFDPTGGRKDLKSRIIRFVGDPKKRIDEDALRMLRAVRFASTLGFKLEKNSFAAIKTRAKLIQSISGERIKQELDKILLSPNRAAGLKLLDEIGLLKFILPELSVLKKIDHRSRTFHLEGDMFTHTLRVIDLLPKDLDLLYAGIFHDTGKQKVSQTEWVKGEKIIRHRGHQIESCKLFLRFALKYKFSRQSRDLIAWLVLHHDDRSGFRDAKELKQIKYALQPNFDKLVELWRADSAGNLRVHSDGKIAPGSGTAAVIGKRYIKKIHSKSDLLKKFSSGEFIIAHTKLAPGIRIGQISDQVKVKIILGEIKNVAEAKNFLQKFSK